MCTKRRTEGEERMKNVVMIFVINSSSYQVEELYISNERGNL